MKKEKFRVYIYSYEYGPEMIVRHNEEEVYDLINNLDPYEYSQYIIIKELPDRDEPFDYGFIAKPKTMKLKLDKKKKKK